MSAQIRFEAYSNDKEATYLPSIRTLISDGLSEPYSIYVYRYFLHTWGDLCYLVCAVRWYKDIDPTGTQRALDGNDLVGVVISKLERHREVGPLRGYIAMLVIREAYRGRGLATKLVRMAIDAMIERNADEVALETEITNTSAIKLYEHLGFLRSKRLHRYYLNGNSAYRLVLYLKEGSPRQDTDVMDEEMEMYA